MATPAGMGEGMITLYQQEISPFCDKVRRILHVKRQPFEVREIDLVSRAAGRLRKINPARKVPVIDHDGRVVFDSTDIAYYLEECFPEPALVPSQPAERALVHVLEDWADESLYFYEAHLRFAMRHNAQKWVPELTKYEGPALRRMARVVVPREIRALTRAQGTGRKSPATFRADLERHVASVADMLGDRRFLVGTALSLADIAVFAQFFCIRATVEGWSLVHVRPRVAEWMDRVDHATSPPALLAAAADG